MACEAVDDGFRCRVRVGIDRGATRHTVSVAAGTLARLAPGAGTPDELVRASFEYLLEREPRESILRTFDLPIIERYFPGYEAEVRSRLAPDPRG